jgi:hypothetical protein
MKSTLTHRVVFVPEDGEPELLAYVTSASQGGLISSFAGEPSRAGGVVVVEPLLGLLSIDDGLPEMRDFEVPTDDDDPLDPEVQDDEGRA